MDDLSQLIQNLPEHERGDARELANNILFMRDKLEETRKDLQFQDIAIPYDNGGGQTGTRRNPAFDAYRDLLKSYQSAILCLRQLLGLDQPSQPKAQEAPKSGLERMRGKYGSLSMVSGGS